MVTMCTTCGARPLTAKNPQRVLKRGLRRYRGDTVVPLTAKNPQRVLKQNAGTAIAVALHTSHSQEPAEGTETRCQTRPAQTPGQPLTAKNPQRVLKPRCEGLTAPTK